MVGARVGQHNFSKGVLSEELWGRVDIAPYSAGVRQGTNVLILKYGGLTKRPGSRLVYEIKDGPQRLIPFEGAYDAAYALLMGQGTMRLASQGGMVVEERLTILGATNARPVVVNVPYHGYSVGDDWAAGGVEGMIEINSRTWRISAIIDAAHFAIDADGRDWGVFTVDGAGGITRSAPPTPPAPDPVVPPVVPPETPPVVAPGGGNPNPGNGGVHPPYCIASSMLVLLANVERDGPGEWIVARDVSVGCWVWTQHETTLQWGAFPVVRSDFIVDDIFVANLMPDASPSHPFGIDGEWCLMAALGRFDRRGKVWSATIADAHTYVARHPGHDVGFLSHNKLNIP